PAFHFDGSANSSSVSGAFNVSATATFTPGAHLDATIGFLQSTLTDNGTSVQVALTGQGPSFQATFDARVNLLADATFAGDTQFPSVGANFILNWKTTNNVNA